MKFSEIWSQLCRKDARLNTDGTKVEFESQNLKRLLEQVYEQGQKSAPKPQSSGVDFGGIFDGMFKGKR